MRGTARVEAGNISWEKAPRHRKGILPQQNRAVKLGDEGFELTPNSLTNSAIPPQSGAESGARNAQEASIDPDLAAVVEAWPRLPEAIQRAMLALVGTESSRTS